MAMTPAERQREYMDRKGEKEKLASLRLAGVFKTPFYETLPDDFSEDSRFSDNFEFMGIPTPEFKDDRGIEAYTLYSEESSADLIEWNKRSLGRAEMMVTALTEAAEDLAFFVNAYKRSEIKQRLAEIEASDLSDTETKKAALKEAARLNKMLDQLDKKVRHTFLQWKVTG